MIVGSHVPSADPLWEASRRSAEVVQIFLSSPLSWKRPIQRSDADTLAQSGLPIYVHAPYLINIAASDPRIREESVSMLDATLKAAAAVDAAGVVVHGGHATAGATFEEGTDRWRMALEGLDHAAPILIENTAGGDSAMARTVDDLAALWETVGGLGIGFCLDTCHAWAAGEALEGLVGRIVAVTGSVDLVHANDSRDGFGSRRDRHTNLGDGKIPPGELLKVILDADAPTVVETPGGAEAQAADIEWIRAGLSRD